MVQQSELWLRWRRTSSYVSSFNKGEPRLLRSQSIYHIIRHKKEFNRAKEILVPIAKRATAGKGVCWVCPSMQGVWGQSKRGGGGGKCGRNPERNPEEDWGVWKSVSGQQSTWGSRDSRGCMAKCTAELMWPRARLAGNSLISQTGRLTSEHCVKDRLDRKAGRLEGQTWKW